MKIYSTGLPSGYEVEHLVRLFYPMAPLTLTPPENAEDCVWAEKTPDGLHALVRQDGRSAERHAPLPAPAEQGGETPEFSLASLTYDLLRDWTGIRPPWGKMTGVRPVRLIHDKRAAGWTEAGRPDCTDAEKLAVIKEYGATRISINPQTFSDEVLAGIGRKHSAQDILDCYAEARKAGHDDINMDLIAGLPGDTVESFERSLRQAIALDPENITVHTLTLKRASRIVMEDQSTNDYADVAAMLEKCRLLAEAGYRPYYLYRQKNTLQNLENVGWCKPGHEGYYNIYIMEEVQTILSAGAGGSTKLVADGGKRMQRIFNFKYPNEYIQRFAEVLERKKGVADFYDHDLGTETSG